MEFHILGPLEVVHHGRVAKIGGPKEQALLAMLLLNARTPVSAARLSDALWGDSPPPSAKVTTRGYVASLRKALGHGEARSGANTLRTTAGGYAMEVSDAQIDLRRFESALQRARVARAAGSIPQAAQLCAEAVGLWRGDLLEGLEGHEFARHEAMRVEPLKVACTELWLDLRVQMGEHEQVVDELGSFCAAHPLREVALGAWLLALYRCGRQAEALEAFDAGRRRLRDDLGVDPSPDLQRLHTDILAHAQTLTCRSAPTPRRRSPLPVQLTSFVGREQELSRIRERVRDRRLVTLTGIGGTGKTRLAIEVARTVDLGFTDGAAFCDLTTLRGPGGVDGVISSTVERLGLVGRAREMGARTDLMAALSPLDLLLVLDNCEHVLDGVADVVGDIVNSSPGVHILATSREPLDINGEALIPVPPLSTTDGGQDGPPDAVRLFMDRVEDVDGVTSWTDDEMTTVGDICARLDGIPLAVELAAAQVRFLGVHQIARRLDDRLKLLDGGRGRPDRHRTLCAALDWSHDLLDLEERTLLRRLSVFPGTFTLDAVEGTCGAGLTTSAVALLRSLVRKSLVVTQPSAVEHRYRLLETVRLFAGQRLDGAVESHDMRAQHRDWFLEWVESLPTDELLDLGGGRVADDAHNLRAALEWSRSVDDHAAVGRMAGAMVGYYSVGTDLHEADSLFAVEHNPDLEPDARLRLAAAKAWIDLLARPTEALESAEAAAAMADGLTGTWAALANGIACVTSAFTYQQTADPRLPSRVIDYERKALALADDDVIRTYTLHLVADARIFVGDLPGAIKLLEAALALIHDTRERTASVVPNLLEAYHLAGRDDEADRLLLGLTRAGPDLGPARAPRLAAAAALTHAAASRREEALMLLQRASREPSPLPGVVGQVLTTLGAVAALVEDWERASTLLAAAAARGHRGLPMGRAATDIALYQHYTRRVRTALDEATAARCRERGHRLRAHEAIALGLALDG